MCGCTAKMSWLKKLNLYNNRINNIPLKFDNLFTTLDAFDLGRNPLKVRTLPCRHPPPS